MNELALFSGVGGGLLASILLGHRIIGAVEWDDYCCRVLEQRQKDGYLEPFPIWNMDIRDFNIRVAPMYRGVVDVISAGFPCQPFSVAGNRAGEDDPRNMWPATMGTVRIVQPRYVFLENVTGLLSSGYFGRILSDLAESGYSTRWTVLGASDVGAPHRRKRLWILAHATECSDFGGISRRGQRTVAEGNAREDVADSLRGLRDRGTDEQGREKEGGASPLGNGSWWSSDPAGADADEFHGNGGGLQSSPLSQQRSQAGPMYRWGVESRVGVLADGLAHRLGEFGPAVRGPIPRVAKGVPKRGNRLKALGNGQVPLCAATAFRSPEPDCQPGRGEGGVRWIDR